MVWDRHMVEQYLKYLVTKQFIEIVLLTYYLMSMYPEHTSLIGIANKKQLMVIAGNQPVQEKT